MPESTKAVFLSYASQDVEVAARIAEALRTVGVEVWLDQEGGLVGGDAWDRKIREQINGCALFVPIVSANTQARHEGYFRLEWKLAEDRSHLIAKGKPFIVPVSVDGTSERGALVPDAFLAVQWTRLPGGEAPAAFVARVKKLLGAPPTEPASAVSGASGPRTEAALPAAAISETDFAALLPPSAPAEPSIQPRKGRERWWQIVAAVALVIAAGLAFLLLRQTPPAQQTFRYTLSGPPDCTQLLSFAISPDGKSVAMAAMVNGKPQLWLRALDRLETRPIPFTEEGTQPFWSPDGRYLGFFAQRKLKKVAVSGGPAQTLCDADTVRGGSWNRDNVIVFATVMNEKTKRVAAAGGVPVDLPGSDAARRFPVFLPDGHRFLWVAGPGTATKGGIYLTSLDGKEERRIMEGEVSSVHFARGERRSHLLFQRGGTLMALPFDAADAKATGEPFPVAENIRDAGVYTAATVSANGMLVYAHGDAAEMNQISWFDRSGKLLGPVIAPGPVSQPVISPDEKRVIFRRGDRTKGELWLRELNRGSQTRLSGGAHNDGFPVWSPEGDQIVFGSDRDSRTKLYQRAANGSGQEELLLPTNFQHTPLQWSRDGQFIVYSERTTGARDSLWVLPLKAVAAERRPVLFLQPATYGQISPDGRWMAFTARRAQRNDVYVRPFPSGDGEWQISIADGTAPRWRADGKEMFFVAKSGKIMAVPVNAPAGPKPVFEAGVPVALFDTTRLESSAESRQQYHYDVSADGSRFLIAHSVKSDTPTAPTLTVVTNWLAGLEK